MAGGAESPSWGSKTEAHSPKTLENTQKKPVPAPPHRPGDRLTPGVRCAGGEKDGSGEWGAGHRRLKTCGHFRHTG